MGSLTGVRLPARPDKGHSPDSPHWGPAPGGEGGLGRSHRGAAPPGGSSGICTAPSTPSPGPRSPVKAPSPTDPLRKQQWSALLAEAP